MASVLVGRPIAPKTKEAWGKHLKVASFYSVLIATAHRRTHSTWPKVSKDYQLVWDSARDLVLYSKYTVYYFKSEDYPYRDKPEDFPFDWAALYEKWKNNQVETEEDIAAALVEIDQGNTNKMG